MKPISRTKEDQQAQLADLHQEQGSMVAWLDRYTRRQRNERIYSRVLQETPLLPKSFILKCLVKQKAPRSAAAWIDKAEEQIARGERRLELKLAGRT